MANLRANKIVGIGSTDAGVVFQGGVKINSQGAMYFPTGDTIQRGRGRGLIAGGSTPHTDDIEYLQIQSQGTAIDFGNLTSSRFGLAGCASDTRGLFGGGATPTKLNTIEYVTIATTANAADFGDLTTASRDKSSLSSATRGIWGGGDTGSVSDVIDFVTIASAGNATDFGNLLSAETSFTACSSPTRGLFAGGADPTAQNVIQYITIASAGNAADFGDLTAALLGMASASSNTRGVFGGGNPGATNVIQYVTIASAGNATDFGDLTAGRAQPGQGNLSNSIRGLFVGGYIPSPTSSDQNIIDYITFASTGNAKDFGDINRAANDSNRELGLCSDSHGGLTE